MPVYANIPPFSWAYNPDLPHYTLDVAGAKALIESSGWALGADGIYAKGGKRLSTTLYVRVGRPQRLTFAQLARDQLKECGIEVEVQEADLNTVLIPKVLDFPNDFDTYLGGWSTALDPDDFSIFHSSEIPTKDNPSANNFPGWKNAAGRQAPRGGPHRARPGQAQGHLLPVPGHHPRRRAVLLPVGRQGSHGTLGTRDVAERATRPDVGWHQLLQHRRLDRCPVGTCPRT